MLPALSSACTDKVCHPAPRPLSVLDAAAAQADHVPESSLVW